MITNTISIGNSTSNALINSTSISISGISLNNISVGGNVSANIVIANTIDVGNTATNATISSLQLAFNNSSGSSYYNAAGFSLLSGAQIDAFGDFSSVGNASLANTTSTFNVGNSTINTIVNSTSITVINDNISNLISVGSNVAVNTSTILINNPGVSNLVANASSLTISNTSATSTYTVQGANLAPNAAILFFNSTSYSIAMNPYATYGRLDTVSDYNLNFIMAGSGTNRGFVFSNNSGPTAQIDAAGNFYAIGNGYFVNTTSTLVVGNSTVQTVINSTTISTNTFIVSNISTANIFTTSINTTSIYTTSINASSINTTSINTTSVNTSSINAITINTTNVSTVNETVSNALNIGSNLTANTSTLYITNSTVSWIANNSETYVGNSIISSTVNSTSLNFTNTTYGTSFYGLTGISLANNATLSIGNSTVNTVANSTTIRYSDDTFMATARSIGRRNMLINGAIDIDQRYSNSTGYTNNTPCTINSTGVYVCDRWYAYTGAGTTTGGKQVNQWSATTNPTYNGTFRNALVIYGNTSVSSITVGQRIEANNSYLFAGANTTISLFCTSNGTTSLSWAAYYAGSNDNFGTFASPSRTQIATGSWTINTTFQQYSAQIAIPTAATTGLEIEFTSGAITSTTNTIAFSGMQWEVGNVVTPYDYRSITQELADCQRYFQIWRDNGGASTEFANFGYMVANNQALVTMSMPVVPRIAPTTMLYPLVGQFVVTATGYTTGSITIGNYATGLLYVLANTTTNVSSTGGPAGLRANAANTFLAVSVEL